MNEFDIIVVGCGHAGCEAAHASAKLGAKTLMVGLNMDSIAWMPCNPAIGGPAKSHIVKEIDALGGVMGEAADASYLQMKTLNTSRGAAVHSLRAQSDKYQYSRYVRQCLEKQPNLYFYQAMVAELLIIGDTVTGVRTKLGEEIKAKAVIITSGTFLQGKVFTGKKTYDSGRASEPSAVGLTACLENYGFEFGRLKTGTPARLDARSIDFNKLEIHSGDETITHFSHLPNRPLRPQHNCHSTRTNQVTHQIIQDNILESPMYSGVIEGTGPRYCPSIEDKIIKFPDKESHLLFLEPESLDTNEIYLQGCSTSFPIHVQRQLIQSIEGLEKSHIIRPAYAVEYDFLKPVQMQKTLQSQTLKGFFAAGQLLGTSGYEEAASQGLIAGINAVQYINHQEAFVLERSESYIGTLIDDLIYKDISEPYRMMTSRSEYRLHLRQDNADRRLTPLGRSIGLVGDFRWKIFEEKLDNYHSEMKLLSKTRITQDRLPSTIQIHNSITLADLLTRNDVDYTLIDSVLERDIGQTTNIPRLEIQTEIKYAGYVARQRSHAKKFQNLQSKCIPSDLDFLGISHLSTEAREKLNSLRPKTLGEAIKIDGVRQADINVLLVALKKHPKN